MNHKRIIDALYLCMVEISEKFYVFKTLFRNGESLELLSKHDYGIFSIFQDSLANDLIACLFRVLDPEKSCGKENLSFDYLRKNSQLTESIEKKIERMYKIKGKVKHYRDKIISHNDLNRILKPEEQEEIFFKWSEISELVSLGQSIIKEILRNDYNEERAFLPSNVNPDTFLDDLRKK